MAYKKETAFSVHVINPTKRSGSRRKRRSKKAAKKTAANPAKKKAAKKTAKKAPDDMAKKRRKKTTRRRKTRGATTTRRITRRNPTRHNPTRRRRARKAIGTGITALTNELKPALQRTLGMLVAGWAVRRWSSTPGGIWPGQAHTSPTAGEGWSLPQYAIAGAIAMWAPPLLKRFIDPREFRRGVVDLMVQKLVYTEAIARSPMLQRQFGTGDVAYDGHQAYVESGGRWNAMQGLVEKSALDGLVEMSPLDGMGDMGHLMPKGTQTQSSIYSGTGYENPYHAAFRR